MSAKEFATKMIQGNQIAIFSKSYCPYCRKAKGLLEKHNLKYQVAELDQMENGDEIQSYLKELTNQSTVPNIFVKSKHLGGSDSLQAAMDRGTFFDLLK